MERLYTTSEVARIMGVHSNTVRLYEKLGLIPVVERKQNGYRIFTKRHIDQFRLARTALQVEVLQNGLRKQAIEIVKTSARGDFNEAIRLTSLYLSHIETEKSHAEEAIQLVEQLLSSEEEQAQSLQLTRKEAAELLNITIDTLRNWELNGLHSVRRKQNGYRVYTDRDIQRLKIIRSLRCANYSLVAILRLLSELSNNPQANIRTAIDTPSANEAILTACDSLLTSLQHSAENAQYMYEQLVEMRNDRDRTLL